MRLPRITVRVFGILNITFGLVGFYFVADGLARHWHLGVSRPETPHSAIAYYTTVGVNVLFLVFLLVSGILLVKRRRKGLVISNAVFSCEIGYWVLIPLLLMLLGAIGGETAPKVGMSVAAVFGTGNVGIALHSLIGYPLIALIFLNLADRSLRRGGHWDPSRRGGPALPDSDLSRG